MKKYYILFVLFLLNNILMVSCNGERFTRTKAPTKKIYSLNRSTSIKIKSYTLTYNPKSNGFIKLVLATGAEYQAKSVDGGSFSSINALLKEPSVLFDTTRKEVIINNIIAN